MISRLSVAVSISSWLAVFGAAAAQEYEPSEKSAASSNQTDFELLPDVGADGTTPLHSGQPAPVQVAPGQSGPFENNRPTLFAVRSTPMILPSPPDRNSMIRDVITGRSLLGRGFALQTPDSYGALDNVKFALGADIKLNSSYDWESGLDPLDVPLAGSPDTVSNGKFAMNAGSTGFLLGGENDDGVRVVQGFVETRIADDQSLEFRHAFGRLDIFQNLDRQISLFGGTTFTTFGDQVALPVSLVSNAAPVGSVISDQVTQLGASLLDGEPWSVTAAIENPNSSDSTFLSDADTALNRWPDLIARVRFEDPLSPNQFDGFQVAGIIRTLGFQDETGAENFITAYGVSGSARIRVNKSTNSNLRLGGVAGRGVARYIHGLSGAGVDAGPLNGLVKPLDNASAYISYQRRLDDGLIWNASYGYALAESTPEMDDNAIRKSQNTWINVTRLLADNVAIGLEYHYSTRRVRDGRFGENQRLQLSIEWVPAVDESDSEPAGVQRALRRGKRL